jgi:hypothetical protein
VKLKPIGYCRGDILDKHEKRKRFIENAAMTAKEAAKEAKAKKAAAKKAAKAEPEVAEESETSE